MVKTEEMLKNLEELINTPSVVGFYPEIHKKLAEMVGKFGYELEFDNKRTAYVRVPGKDSSKIVCVGAHLDTIGMQVRHVMDNGWIEVKTWVESISIMWKGRMSIFTLVVEKHMRVW